MATNTTEETYNGFLNNTQLELMMERKSQADPSGLLVPIHMLTGPALEETVTRQSVTLKTRVVWYGEGTHNFYHEEKLKDTHNFKHAYTVVVNDGAQVGSRHPILHPAVAAIDVMSGGIDDAFMRAMQNVETIVGGGMRTEASVSMRAVAMRYSQLPYNALRVLVRAAVLLTNMYIGGKHESVEDYRPIRTMAPVHFHGVLGYSAFLDAQQGDFRDVLYVQCQTAGEMYMVDVMHALCSATFPMVKYGTVADIWPELNNPVAAYSGGVGMRIPPFKMSVDTLVATMHRFCTIFDCHDQWAEALGAVQALTARPTASGMLGALQTVVWGLPRSDMRVGAIGPLLAGLSAEGRKTEPFRMPGREEFLYSACVRGVFFTAAYYDRAQESFDAHPVALAIRNRDITAYGALTDPIAARAFMADKVAPRAAQMGWDCVNWLLTSVRPAMGKGWQRFMFRPHLVPWWTTVCNHLHIAASQELATWLKPSQLSAAPIPNMWQPFHAVGATTPLQMAAAVRWMGAKVKYTRVQIPTGMKSTDLQLGTHTRFLPRVLPKFQLSSNTSVIGSVIFPSWGGELHSFVRNLGLARCAMYPDIEGEVHYDYGQLPDEGSFTDGDLGGQDSTDAPDDADTQDVDEASDAAKRAEAQYAEILEAEHDKEPPTMPQRREIEMMLFNQLKESGMFPKEGSYMASFEPVGAPTAALATRGAQTAASVMMDRFYVGKDDRAALLALRTYLHYATRVAPHADMTDGVSSQLSRRIREALDRVQHLKGRVEKPKRWSDIVEEQEEAAIREAVSAAGALSGDVSEAVDDPGVADTSPQDFGAGTSQPASGTAATTAGDVPASSQATPSIGFLPPATS